MKIRKIGYVMAPIIAIGTPFTVLTSCTKTLNSVNAGWDVTSCIKEQSTQNIDYVLEAINESKGVDNEEISLSLGETKSINFYRDQHNVGTINTSELQLGNGGSEDQFNAPYLSNNHTINISTVDKSHDLRLLAQKFCFDVTVPAYSLDYPYIVKFSNKLNTNSNMDFFSGTELFITTQLFDIDNENDWPDFFTNKFQSQQVDTKCGDSSHFFKFEEHEGGMFTRENTEEFTFVKKIKLSNPSSEPITYRKYYVLSTLINGTAFKYGRTTYSLETDVNVHTNSKYSSQAAMENKFSQKILDASKKDILSDANFTHDNLSQAYDHQKENLEKFKKLDTSKIKNEKVAETFQKLKEQINPKFNSGNEFADYYLNHRDEYQAQANLSIEIKKNIQEKERKDNPLGWQTFTYEPNDEIGLKGFNIDKYDNPTVDFNSLKSPNQADPQASNFENGYTVDATGIKLASPNFSKNARAIYLPIKLEIVSPAKMNSLSNTITGWEINLSTKSDVSLFTAVPNRNYSFQIFDFGSDSKAVPEFLNFPYTFDDNISTPVDKNCVFCKYFNDYGTSDGPLESKHFIYDPLNADQIDSKQVLLNNSMNENSESPTKICKYYGISIACDDHTDEDWQAWSFDADFTPTAIDLNTCIENVNKKIYTSSNMDDNNKEIIPLSDMNKTFEEVGYKATEGIDNTLYEGNFSTDLRAMYTRPRLSVTLPAHTTAFLNVNVSAKAEAFRDTRWTAWDIMGANNLSLFDIGDPNAPDPSFIPTTSYNRDIKTDQDAINNKLIFSRSKSLYGKRNWKEILCVSIILLIIVLTFVVPLVITSIPSTFVADVATKELIAGTEIVDAATESSIQSFATPPQHLSLYSAIASQSIAFTPQLTTAQIVKCILGIVSIVSACAFLGYELIFNRPWNKKHLFYINSSNLDDGSEKYENMCAKSIVLSNNSDKEEKVSYDFGIGYVHAAQRSKEIDTQPQLLTKFDVSVIKLVKC